MIDPNKLAALANDEDREAELEFLQRESFRTVFKAFRDLVQFGLDSGFTANQSRGAVEDLFRTYLASWVLYLFIGAEDIITDITNDATLPWLDFDANGQTIRTRLINRLQ